MFNKQIEKIPASGPRKLDTLPGLRFEAPSRFVIAIGLIIILFAIFIWVIETIGEIDSYQLAKHGLLFPAAKVVAVEEKIKNDRLYQSVKYEFTSKAGNVFMGEDNVRHGSVYSSLQEGDTVPVLYLPERPTVNMIDSGDVSSINTPAFLVGFMLIFFVLFLALAYPHLLWLLRYRRIYKYGEIKLGKLEFVRPGKEFIGQAQNGGYVDVHFTFVDKKQNQISAKMKSNNHWLLNQLTPGQELTVIYNPARPKKALLAEFFVK